MRLSERSFARELDHASEAEAVSSPRPRQAGRHWLDRWCLDRMAASFKGVPVQVRLWNGLTASLSDAPPVASIHIGDRGTLVRLLVQPELEFGEAYTAGRLQVRGDLTSLFDVTNRAVASHTPPSWSVRLSRRLVGASMMGARGNIRRHYDLGNAFYRLWLDEAMVYTCAYFDRPEATLEEAQWAKLEYVCRKLQLAPGDEVIEAGCGWGGLALHMARHHGVRVRAYNICRSQLDYARARAEAEGLADRVRFIDADYRAIEGRCDAFVSIGMLEHVGPRQYRALGEVIDRTLDPAAGRGLLHFIGRHTPRPLNAWTTRHIFPGTYAPTLGEVSPALFERSGLAVHDVEDLRSHYASTLAHWQERFEAHVDQVRKMFDEPFVRMWRMYLATARAGFLSGDLQLYQITFARALSPHVPATRHALYPSQGVGVANGRSAARQL
jgi:cyclopropane-fatty-acyl-phospholipid synthase